jgi:hypothetical protein
MLNYTKIIRFLLLPTATKHFICSKRKKKQELEKFRSKFSECIDLEVIKQLENSENYALKRF